MSSTRAAAVRGRARSGAGAFQWMALLTAAAVIMSLTFALGVLVGRQWNRPASATASVETAARKTVPPGRRGGLSGADVEPAPDQKLTFYQTLAAPLGRGSADASQPRNDKGRKEHAAQSPTAPFGSPKAEPLASPAATSQSGGREETLIEKPAQTKPPAESSGPWAVQAGAFKARAQADGLEKQLRQAGFDAYVTQAAGEDGQTRYRVRVGTFNSKAEAQQMADRMRVDRSMAAFVAPK
jgi:cell division septation protein DedD